MYTSKLYTRYSTNIYQILYTRSTTDEKMLQTNTSKLVKRESLALASQLQ